MNWIDPYGLSRFWRWTKWDVIPPVAVTHFIFDSGVVVGDKICGIPKFVRKCKGMVESPKKIREKRKQQIEEISKLGEMPKTAGPVDDFNRWRKDTTDVVTSVPGTVATGPPPTGLSNVLVDTAKETAVEVIDEAVNEVVNEAANEEKDSP